MRSELQYPEENVLVHLGHKLAVVPKVARRHILLALKICHKSQGPDSAPRIHPCLPWQVFSGILGETFYFIFPNTVKTSRTVLPRKKKKKKAHLFLRNKRTLNFSGKNISFSYLIHFLSLFLSPQ